jgi:methionyl-tRNA formyltransferase
MCADYNYKIVFIGGTKRGYILLEELFKKRSENICYIVAMPEDIHETEKYSSKIEKIARDNNKPFKLCKKLDEKDIEDILLTSPDIALIVGWRTLIDSKLYKYPKYGAWAAHDSLLPKYRGFAPLNWAIINGEDRTGVSLFRVDEGMDTGPLINSKEIIIEENDTAAEIYNSVIDATVEVVFESLNMLEQGTIKHIAQDESKATYTCPRTPADGYIDWNKPAVEIKRLVQALSLPYPCAYSFYKGEIFKIISCEIPELQVTYAGNIPGRPIRIHDNNGVEVLTGNGILLIKEIMTKDKKIMTADKLIKSIKTTLGLSVLDLYSLLKKREE